MWKKCVWHANNTIFTQHFAMSVTPVTVLPLARVVKKYNNKKLKRKEVLCVFVRGRLSQCESLAVGVGVVLSGGLTRVKMGCATAQLSIFHCSNDYSTLDLLF